MASAPVETKVTAATAGSAIGGLILWLTAKYLFEGENPPEIVMFVGSLVVPALITFVSGYMAAHTPRHDPAAGVGPGQD